MFRYAILDENCVCKCILGTEFDEEPEECQCVALDSDILSKDVIGKKYINGKWMMSEPEPEPTQADRIEENQLILMEAMAEQYEESLENRLNDMEVQATIYETLLEIQGGN